MRAKISMRLDWLLMVFFPLAAALLSLVFRVNLFTSVFLFLGLPSIWLSIRAWKYVPRVLLFSFCFLPVAFFIELIAVRGGAWYIPHTIFPRLFGAVVVEDILWAFLTVYLVAMYYEYFFDHGSRLLIGKRLRYFIPIVGVVGCLFALIVILPPAFSTVPYAYLWIGIVLVLIPSVVVLSRFNNLLPKFIHASLYFFGFSLLYELTALELGVWEFPGAFFVGWVTIAGYRFPFEEFVFWMILGAVAILSFYEFFDDDRR